MQQRNSKGLQWGRVALLTAGIMVALWLLVLLVFKVPQIGLHIPDSAGIAIFVVLLFPGALLVMPTMLFKVHSYWPGLWAVGGVLNWLFYTQIIYWFMKRHLRKREAHNDAFR